MAPLIPAAMAAYALTVGTLTGGPACPIYRFLGIPCPGCGGTRAVLSLLHGHFEAAVAYNAYFLLVALLGTVLWARWTLRRASGVAVPFLRPPAWAAWSFFFCTLAWFIVRLLPAYPGVHL